MKLDLGVLNQTSTVYDKAIPKFEDNGKKLNNLITYLIDNGWSGKGAEQFKVRLDYFFEKQYKPLQKTLEVLNSTLKDVVKAKGQLLKQQCEEFANCFFTGEGYAEGVLSLEYDNVNRIINVYNEIASETNGMFRGSSCDMLSKKDKRLHELKNDIKREGFFSGR